MNTLPNLLKLFIFILISNMTISCGSSDKKTDTPNIEYNSMEIFQIYAIQNGESDAPRVFDYHVIGITKINYDNVYEANQLIAGAEKESILTPIDIQTLLYDSGLFNNFTQPTSTSQPTSQPTPLTLTYHPVPDFGEDNASAVFEYREIETKTKINVVFSLEGHHTIAFNINQENIVDENNTYRDEGFTLTNKNAPPYSNELSPIDEYNLKELIKTKDCKVDTTKQGVYYCTYQLTWDRKQYEITRVIMIIDGEYASSTPAPAPSSTPKLTLEDVDMKLAYNYFFTENQDEPIEAGRNYNDPGVAYYNKQNGKRFYVINIVKDILEYAFERDANGRKIKDENGHVIPVLDENGNYLFARDSEGRARRIGYRSENQLSYNSQPRYEYNTTTKLKQYYNNDRVILYEGEKNISSIFWSNFKVLSSVSTGVTVTLLMEGTFNIPYIVSHKRDDSSKYEEVLRVERKINAVDTSSPKIIFPSNITFKSKDKKFTLSADEIRGVVYSLAGENSKYFKIDHNGKMLKLSDLAVNGEYVIELIATEKFIPKDKEANPSSVQTVIITINI